MKWWSSLTEGDLRHWHERSGIPYPFPELCGPGWLPVIGSGAAALGLKLQLECYLWVNPDATKRARAQSLLELERTAIERTQGLQLDEAVCWLPPLLIPSFSPILERRGWRRSPWPSWSRQL